MKKNTTSRIHILATSLLIGAVILTACHTTKAKPDNNISDANSNSIAATFDSKSSGVSSLPYNDSDIVTDSYGDIALDTEHFPDSIFRKYIAQFDTDHDGTLSATERGKVFEINLHEDGILTSQEIWDIETLEGLQYFPSLVRLDCSGAGINTLDVNALSNLTYLNCCMDDLSELDVTHNPSLRKLYCSTNHISSIDLTNNSQLTHFYCIGNDLTTLDVSKCPHLTELDLSQNNLASIDLSVNHELQFLACVCNHLETVTMPRSTLLHYVDLTANENLAELDVTYNPILIALLKRGPIKGRNANTWEIASNGAKFLQTDNTVEVYRTVG